MSITARDQPSSGAITRRRRRAGPAWPVSRGRQLAVLLVACGAMLAVMADTVAATLAIAALAESGARDGVFPDAVAARLGLGGLSWLSSAFLVPFAACLTVGGQLADRLGRRLVLVVGLVIFVSGAVAVAAAGHWLVLLAARAGQAFGAALMIPASLGLLVAHLPAQRRSVAIGWWSGASGLGGLVLHAGGAALVEQFGWRMLLLPELVVVAALAVLLPAVPASRGDVGRLPDLLGAVLLLAGIGALVLAICQGPSWGWTSVRILGLVGSGLSAVAGALLRSVRHPSPAVQLGLWRERGFAWGWTLSLLYGLLSLPLLVFAPSYLAALGWSGWQSSAVLAPMSAMVLLAGPAAGALCRPKPGGEQILLWRLPGVVYGGAVLVIAAGIVLAATQIPAPVRLSAVAVLGLGLGALSAAASIATTAAAPQQHYASASGASMTARQAGGALGVAAGSVALAHPVVPGPNGYLTVLAGCLLVAGLCGLAALLRALTGTLCRAAPPAAAVTDTGGLAAPALAPLSVPAVDASAYRHARAPSRARSEAAEQVAVPREVLEHLHAALLEVGASAESWLGSQRRASEGVLPAVTTGAIAKGCACHADLDPLEATLLHSLPTQRRPPLHERLV